MHSRCAVLLIRCLTEIAAAELGVCDTQLASCIPACGAAACCSGLENLLNCTV
jgi:hypothetical protein